MLFKLILKLSAPIRILLDLVFLVVLVALFAPVLDFLKPGVALGIFQKTLIQGLIRDLSIILPLSIITVFAGLSVAWMTRQNWPGRAFAMLGVLILVLFPDFMQALVGAPLTLLFVKKSALNGGAASFLAPFAASCLIGWSISSSIPMPQQTSLQSHGAGGMGLYRHLYLPRCLLPGLGLCILFFPFMIAQGFSLSALSEWKQAGIAWHLYGPDALLANRPATQIAYLFLLATSLLGGFLLTIGLKPSDSTFGSGADSGGSSLGQKRRVTRKKKRKRKAVKETQSLPVEAPKKVTETEPEKEEAPEEIMEETPDAEEEEDKS